MFRRQKTAVNIHLINLEICNPHEPSEHYRALLEKYFITKDWPL